MVGAWHPSSSPSGILRPRRRTRSPLRPALEVGADLVESTSSSRATARWCYPRVTLERTTSAGASRAGPGEVRAVSAGFPALRRGYAGRVPRPGPVLGLMRDAPRDAGDQPDSVPMMPTRHESRTVGRCPRGMEGDVALISFSAAPSFARDMPRDRARASLLPRGPASAGRRARGLHARMRKRGCCRRPARPGARGRAQVATWVVDDPGELPRSRLRPLRHRSNRPGVRRGHPDAETGSSRRAGVLFCRLSSTRPRPVSAPRPRGRPSLFSVKRSGWAPMVRGLLLLGT